MMSDEEDKVGYKRPPAQHRFKKGRSGNPAGRPRNAKTAVGGQPLASWWHDTWLKGANKVVNVTINGRPVRRTMGELTVERILAEAAAGKPTAMRLATQMLSAAERVKREQVLEELETLAIVQQRQSEEMDRRLAAGEVDPLVIPHPDDFVFNKETGMMELAGPIDVEQHKAAMLAVRLCHPIVAMLDSDQFSCADDSRRRAAIDQLAKLNSSLPPRLQQWPRPRFAEDYELFPPACVKSWILGEV